MKVTLFKSILAIATLFFALPMMAQDFLNIYFKDGTTRKFYLQGVTEIFTSQYDESGVKQSDYSFQHVTTPYNDYVYNLADIDSIAFSKFDEEKTRRDFTSAMRTTLNSLSECESIDDAEQMLGQIKAAEGVEDAWSDGHELFVKINDWDTISFHFNHDDEEDAEEEIGNSVKNIREMIPQMVKLLGKDGHRPKVVIANQQHYDERPACKKRIVKYYKPLLEDFKACGFDPDESIYLDRPTVNFFATDMYKYDVVYLITHGGCGNNQHHVLSGEELCKVIKLFNNDEDPSDNSYKNLYEKYLKAKKNTIYENVSNDMLYCSFNLEIRNNMLPYWVGHPSIKEAFFGKRGVSKGYFPQGAIFFNAACLTMKGDDNNPEFWHSFADSLVNNHGLSLYFGYDDENYKGPLAGYLFLSSMLQGKSACAAFNNLDSQYREEMSIYHAKLKWWPELNDKLFLWPTYTKKISEEVANTNYRFNQSVEVEGWTTVLNPEQNPETIKDNITIGFQYNTTEDVMGVDGRLTYEVSLIPLNTDKGNLAFRADLTGLALGQTYYYRAFTYDGYNINYGDTYSFTLYPNLQIVTTSLSLNVGQTKTVNITSGSGSYKIEIISGKNAVVASLNGNVISVTGKTAGNATIKVTDTKTGQTATIEVTVTAAAISDLAISASTLSMIIGETTTVEITSGSGEYGVTNLNSSIAKATLNGTTITINALAEGNAKIVVTDMQTDQTIIIEVTVTAGGDITAYTSCPDANHPHWIDLGLPSGIKWACCNLGASAPEKIGDYYAWGENSPNWYMELYDYSMEGINPDHLFYMTKYCSNSDCGVVDNKISLELGDDVAHVKLGGNKRMPSIEEINELINNCTYEKTTLNGVNVYKFTGNGKSIFFPTTGGWSYGRLDDIDTVGEYWSRSLETRLCYRAKCLFFTYYYYEPQEGQTERYKCKPVRAVMVPTVDNQTELVDFKLSNYSPLHIKIGESKTVNILSGNGVYSYTTTIVGLVTAQVNSNNFVVSGLKTGTTTLIFTDKLSGQDIMLRVTVCPDKETPADAVDLGLPSGTKWASHNVGAQRPEEYGSYFAWGETVEKDVYNKNTYLYTKENMETYFYLDEPRYQTDIMGTCYDVAHEKWRGLWVLPTPEQCEELIDNCDSEWTDINGKKCLKLIGGNGNYIILPAAGVRIGSELQADGRIGYIWNSHSVYGGPYNYVGAGGVLDIEEGEDIPDIGYEGKEYGFSVRPVLGNPNDIEDPHGPDD